jgi:hypothetical protein|nr:hypothetical protein [Panacagrimonas sp.]
MHADARASTTVIFTLAAVACFFAGICAVAWISGEISIGRPMRVHHRLAQSPVRFWLVWGLWASLSVASAFGAAWLSRYGRRHRV